MNKRPLHVRIIHTNDLHSHFEHVPRMATAIQNLKQESTPDVVLTLDIGDFLDRMHPATEGTNGIANIELMNTLGYDAAVPGNNEGLTLDKHRLNYLYQQVAKFPIVCANIRDADTGQPPCWSVPHLQIEKAGVSIGLIGVTVSYPDYYNLLGWDVDEPIQVAVQLAEQLRPKVDVLIIMSHLGLPKDRELAERCEADFILGGHTHHVLEQPLEINGTFVCAAGKFGHYVGLAEAWIEPESKQIEHRLAQLLNPNDYEPDIKIAEQIQIFKARGLEQLSKQVAVLEHHLPADPYTEAPLGNLLAAGIRKYTETEIGIVNAGQFLDGLAAGPVTLEMLLRICPSPINPAKIQLRGSDIWQALEESLQRHLQEKVIYGYGFRGKMLGSLNVDGMDIEYDPSANELSRVLAVRIGGKPIDFDRYYHVGTLDMFTFGIGYLSLAKGINVKYSVTRFIREVVQDTLSNTQMLNDCWHKRWHAIN